MEKIKTLELFGGVGAPRSALENLNHFDIKAVDYVEILAQAVKAYNAMYDHKYKQQSVVGWNLDIDLLVHGSPCQDFSSAGNNDIDTGRSILYNETLKIIKDVLSPQPKYVVWENVKGLLSDKHVEHFIHYIKSLDATGYNTYHNILQANEFGIPQTRPRVFAVSIRKDINQVFDFDVLERKVARPMREFLHFDLLHNQSTKLDFSSPSMWSAFEKGRIKIIKTFAKTITTNQMRRDNAGVVVSNKAYYDIQAEDLPTSKYDSGYTYEEFKKHFPQFLTNNHADDFRLLSSRECWALQGYTTSAPDYDTYTNFFTIPRAKDGQKINGQYNRVWNIDKHCGTIPASVNLKVGFTDAEGNLIYKELTAQESWLLQGYKLSQFDSVKAVGISDTDMYKLAGNSICVPVLEAIFKELLIDKKSVSNKYNSMDWISQKNGML